MTLVRQLFTALTMALAAITLQPAGAEDSVFIEAESFAEPGGWKLDTQSIMTMGSPYMIAHGMGKPVENATATVKFPSTGTYHVFARTKDWVARWDAPGAPGKFQIAVNGKTLEHTFGTKSAEWFWEPGGTIEINDTNATVTLQDLTGFDGRCDAIYFTKSGAEPPNESTVLGPWRRKQLGLGEKPTEKSGYDIVVIGGGYSGMGTAISAARMGCKVALVQNRGVLGGNGSSEIRVWAMGHVRRGNYPRVGEIVTEFSDNATKSPGTYEEFEDAKKEAIVRAEPNIDLFLNHHAYHVETKDNQIESVMAFDTRSGDQIRFAGTLFADCTGHATIGFLAGADSEMTPEGRMGMSNMWAWGEADSPTEFPETPWALQLSMDDFPYPRDHHGQWFWESGFDKDPIQHAEAIRDWNLRAVYGAFNAMKNGDGADKHKNAYLTWVAYIGGPRESRRLLGDIVLTQDDVVNKVAYPDGCVPSTWSIDLHYPKEQYAKKFPDNPFISVAVHDRRIDRNYGYPVPYRTFYSRNISNLFMAGRCISVTHEALGTVRVMRTCGMMGEVVGKAASVCVRHDCTPREVYGKYWSEMDELLKLPGKARRETVKSEIMVPDDALPLAPPTGLPTSGKASGHGIDPAKISGLVIDDTKAKKTGGWTEGAGLPKFVGSHYLYGSGKDASIRFEFAAPAQGKHQIMIAYQSHENRSDKVRVEIKTGDDMVTKTVNMKAAPPVDNLFISLGTFELKRGEDCAVTLSADGSGNVHADAIRVVPAK